MSDIIKTIERWRDPERVMAFLCMHDDSPGGAFYFTVGRGRPKQKVERLWFTFQGAVIGHFRIWFFEMNVGKLQEMVERWSRGAGRSLDSEAGKRRVQEFKDPNGKVWRPRPGTWLCFVKPPFVELPDDDRFYFRGFQGWRYFNPEGHGLEVKP